MAKTIVKTNWYVVTQEGEKKFYLFHPDKPTVKLGPFDNIFMPHNSVFAVQKNNKYNFIYKWKYISDIWFDDIEQNYFSDRFYAVVSFGDSYLKLSANGDIADLNNNYISKAKMAKLLLRSKNSKGVKGMLNISISKECLLANDNSKTD